MIGAGQMASPSGSSVKGLATHCALLAGSLALHVGCGFVRPTELPYTQDFSDCDKWPEEDDDHVSLSCEEGHYHFVVKTAPYVQSSGTPLSASVDRVSMSVDASVQDFEATDEIGLACWHGDEDSPGYRASLNPEGHHWYMVREPGQGAAIEDVPATESGSQIPVPAEGEVLHIRVDCLASPSETTLRLFLNGALVGTGHDANGFDQFNAVGMIVGARTSPAAVDFDNFHVEAAQAAEQTASSGTTTSLESEDVLPAETFEAQQVPFGQVGLPRLLVSEGASGAGRTSGPPLHG